MNAVVVTGSAPTLVVRYDPVGVTITYVGGPRDGERSSLVSGEPPAVLVVDDSSGRYVWRDGSYWWTAG